jgi:hypothetical protein
MVACRRTRIGGGAAGQVGSGASGTALNASSKSYACFSGTALTVSDPLRGLLGGVTGANGVVLGTAFTGAVTAGSVQLAPNGTFTYTPPAAPGSCTGTFSFVVNGSTTLMANITQCTSAACGLGGAPTALNDTYTSNIATRFQSAVRGFGE